MASPDETAGKRARTVVAESTMSKWEYVRINQVLSLKSKGTFLTLGGVLALTAIGLATANYWLFLPWLLLGFLMVFNAYQAVRAALSRENANFFLPCRYSFHETGVTAKTPLGEGTVVWGDIVNWEKAAGYYILHVRGRSFLAVPGSAFFAPDAAALESLLRRKIG